MSETDENEGAYEPFLLKPVGKDYIWGGDRLNDEFSKDIDMEPLAETWECSTHPDGPSIVASGEFDGKTLAWVLRLHPEYVGTHPEAEGDIPILIKFIDAEKDLSVQVHPDDDYARENENGARGKTELWYVVDAEKDTRVTYGFDRDMDKETLTAALANGTVERYLQKISIKSGDVFFIEPGTVHAIGAGSLIAEIEENSNLTYRMYDYHRKDKNGNERRLQTDKALDVINLRKSEEPKQPARVIRHERGCDAELLCSCSYFKAERIILDTGKSGEAAVLKTGADSFNVLLCTGGDGDISYRGGKTLHFSRGDCIFVPANSARMEVRGKAEMLRVSC